MKNKGKFITVEGIEGVGKSTSIQAMQQFLEEKHIAHIVTREPGGTPLAEKIREVFLAHHSESMSTDAELLLIFAARAQHLKTVIKPALESGCWVLCDRFTDATYAYQGGGRKIDLTRIELLENFVQGDLRPDLTMLLTAPIEIALARAKERSRPDRIEMEEKDFFERVQGVYRTLADKYSQRYRIIDASQSASHVREQLNKSLQAFIQKIQ